MIDPKSEDQRPTTDERSKTFARRALIQAGWVIPAVGIFAISGEAGAASAHVDGAHQDLGPFNDGGPHSDNQHLDSHSDNGTPHDDAVHLDFDGGHADIVPHFDGGTLSPHTDL